MIKLKNINKKDFKDISYLTSLDKVMKYVGDGKTWNHRKVANFIKYCEIETKQNDKKRTNYYYKIVDIGGNLVGIIGFHLFKSFPNYFLSVYINPKYQGRGYFSKSLSLLLEKVSHHKPKETFIVSLVYEKNEKMNIISNKKFQFMNSIILNGNKLNQYKINVPRINTDVNIEKNKLFVDDFDDFKGNIKNDTTSTKNKFTFLIKSKYLDMNNVRNLFYERGNWQEYNETDKKHHPDFLYIDGSYVWDSSLWNYKPMIKNIVDDDKYTIAYKNNLYKNIKNDDSIKKYILPQLNIDLNDYSDINSLSKFEKLFTKNYVWIFKPVGGFSGIGIKIFDNFETFYKTVKRIIEANKSKWNNPKIKKIKNKLVFKREWIIQQYIDKPLLYKGKKFHMRVFFLYHKKKDDKTNKIVKKGYILDTGCIYTAGSNFVKKDYLNVDIHDTHYKSTPKPIYFQRDFKREYGEDKTKKALKDLKNIFGVVKKNIDANCFKESTYCYELFGADIMLTSSFNMKLIEVNDRIGFATYRNDPVDINKLIFGNILETVIDPLCPPINQPTYFGNMIEV